MHSTDPREHGEHWLYGNFLNNEHSSGGLNEGRGKAQGIIPGSMAHPPPQEVPNPRSLSVDTWLCYVPLEWGSVLNNIALRRCVLLLPLQIDGASTSWSQKHGIGEWLSNAAHSKCFQIDFITRWCLRFKLGNHRSVLQIVEPMCKQLMRQIPSRMTQLHWRCWPQVCHGHFTMSRSAGRAQTIERTLLTEHRFQCLAHSMHSITIC